VPGGGVSPQGAKSIVQNLGRFPATDVATAQFDSSTTCKSVPHGPLEREIEMSAIGVPGANASYSISFRKSRLRNGLRAMKRMYLVIRSLHPPAASRHDAQ
jgi:hypothetical protein